jgi:hypothetical protein
MDDNIKTDIGAEIDAILYAWRTKALNVILTVLAVVALPAVIVPVINALRYGGWDFGLSTYPIGYAIIVTMALWRKLDVRVRGWSLLILGYFVGIMALARGGMAASGRLYLLWLPVIACILVNIRAGIISTVFSLLIYAVCTYLVHLGKLESILPAGIPQSEMENLKSKIENPQSKIAFWVRDNGPGISPEDQARLFAQFERLDQTRVEGHGLGLSIVRRIVEKLHGEVGVTSTIGEGSAFWFTLPSAEQGLGNRD